MAIHWHILKAGTYKHSCIKFKYGFINDDLQIYSGHRTCEKCEALYGWFDADNRKHFIELSIHRGFLPKSESNESGGI